MMAFGIIAEASDDTLVVRATVDKKSIFIGDRARYTIEVRSDKDLDIGFPKFSEDNTEGSMIGDFEIKGSGRKAKKGIFGRRVFSSWYEITAYSAGKHLIGAFEVTYREKGGDWKTKKTNELYLKVDSTIPKGETPVDIKDIKGPLYFYSINPWLLGGALIIFILSALGINTYRKRRAKRRIKTPYEIALEELNAARAFFAEHRDIKDYYVRVTDCVRRYIEDVFSLRAPEMTTEEFLVSLKEEPLFSEDLKYALKEFLQASDMVKFAKYAPTRAETEGVFLTAKNFIDRTKGPSRENGDKR